jgi:DNA-binding MarR family transcriptional regulator
MKLRTGFRFPQNAASNMCLAAKLYFFDMPNTPMLLQLGGVFRLAMEQDRDVAVQVADRIERLGRLVRSRSYAENLNPAQWQALRYLNRCNRFSNNPTALAEFLVATKGTVSQTVSSLERKGLIEKAPRPGQGRSLSLHLTNRGRELLARDPQSDLETAALKLGEQVFALAEKLALLLGQLQAVNDLRSFGTCPTCRYLHRHAPGGTPHRCELMATPLSEPETGLQCLEHRPLPTRGESNGSPRAPVHLPPARTRG